MKWVIGYVVEGSELHFKEQAMNRFGLTVYVPKMRYTRRDMRRRITVEGERPIMGGYAFISMNGPWQKVYDLDLLLYLISNEDQPIEISDSVISYLTEIESNYQDLGSEKKDTRVSPGNIIRITCGPLANMHAIALEGTKGKWVNTVIAGSPMRLPRCIVENV